MSKYLEKVEQFQKTFKAPVLNEPQIPLDRSDLRISLLREELNELIYAIETNDLTEVADAFCDLQYVLSGAIIEFGMKNIFDEMFNEVHRSNMSKACASEQEADQTISTYKLKGVPTYKEFVNGKWLVFRSEDNKVLKSINYSPAELEKYLK